MHDSKKPLPVKSYTNVFGPNPYNNPLYQRPSKMKEWCDVQGAISGESASNINSKILNHPLEALMTSEKFHALNKLISKSDVAHSTSTLFYDLDSVAKRHSFHCVSELNVSNANILKAMNASPRSFFGGKSDAVVQDCTTEVRPTFTMRDSKEIISKRVKRKFPQACVLSSDIFLRDEDNKESIVPKSTVYYDINDINSRPQKFWSYAKYRTEYTKPVSEEKKKKKKDRGKRTEDPCPCQLFSYACPCTDKKSLTELARNSKSLTVADQITSTTKFEPDKKLCFNKKLKKSKQNSEREDKLTSMSGDGVVEKHETEVQKNFSVVQLMTTQEIVKEVEAPAEKKTSRNKARRCRKSCLILCPNCKEKVEFSCTDDEESLKCESTVQRQAEIREATAYAYRATPKNQQKTDEKNDCNHEPPCELVPLCQILPNEIPAIKYSKQSTLKSNPRMIRITKACRHHPPCTVVPSCQRANVLKNNCEYIPPCLHRPRCVNLPLCAPFSKSLHYDGPTDNYVQLDENTECIHVPRCKHVPLCQHDSLENNVVTHVQNACEFLGSYQTPAIFHNQNQTCVPNTYSPCQISSPTSCNCCRSNKSCQYDCVDCKCQHNVLEDSSSNAVIFIRDVGCQFRNKQCSLDGSILQTRICYTSSASFDPPRDTLGSDNYYTNVHTVRCEDKFTTPISGGDYSMSTDSITSMEIDVDCPSHGRRASRKRTSGFSPDSSASPYVTAFMTHTDQKVALYMDAKKKEKDGHVVDLYRYIDGGNTIPVKPRRSSLKGKCRKMFCVKRRRKSKANQLVNCCSRNIYHKYSTVL